MTAKMTDETINFYRNESGTPYLYRFQFADGFRKAEEIYLPQIQQLQGEIETLNSMYNSAEREVDKLRKENEALRNHLKEFGKFTNAITRDL